MTKITDTPDYDIRYSKKEDLPDLVEWISHKEMMRWYPVSNAKEIEDMTKNWIGFSRFGASLTAEYQKRPVGIATLFLMPYLKLVHHSLLYFIVDPEMRGQGIATSIVKNVTHLGKTYFRLEKIHLETYEGCPGLSILKKGGYEEIFRQARFVKEGGAYLDRIVVEKQVKQASDG